MQGEKLYVLEQIVSVSYKDKQRTKLYKYVPDYTNIFLPFLSHPAEIRELFGRQVELPSSYILESGKVYLKPSVEVNFSNGESVVRHFETLAAAKIYAFQLLNKLNYADLL